MDSRTSSEPPSGADARPPAATGPGQGGSPVGRTPDPDNIRAELNRILASRQFSGARAASRFLRYVVEETLEGRGDQLKEYVLGIAVFERGDQYDPKADGVVRVEATRLRSRLRDYYAQHGQTGPVTIELPKGSYIPVFRISAAEASEPPAHAAASSAGSPALESGVPAERAAPGVRMPQARRRAGWPALAIGLLPGLLVLALTGGVGWRKWRALLSSPAPIEAVAVLPLENLSGDPKQQYLADGLTEALTADLGRLPKIRVVARSAVMRYQGARKLLPDIARELNVDALVEGSVVRSGNRVRVVGRIVHPATKRQIWTRTWERDAGEAFAMQAEMVRDLAAELQKAATPASAVPVDNRGAPSGVSGEAYDQYLRGLFYAGRENKADNEAAIRFFETAVAVQPDFAAAHAQLARACVRQFFLFAPGEREWEEKAFVAVRKALELRPDVAEAHRAMGWLLWTPSQRFLHERAIEAHRRALAINPNLEEARHDLGFIYAHIGLLDDALRELERESTINPMSAQTRLRIAQTLLYQSRHEDALPILRTVTPDVNPAIVGFHTAWGLFQVGKKEEATEVLERFSRERSSGTGGLLAALRAMMLASSGNMASAEANIRTAMEEGKGYGHFHHTAYAIASAYALGGKARPAVQWLERAAGEGFPCYPLFAKDRSLDAIRENPEFVVFLERQRVEWEKRKKVIRGE